MYEYTLLLGNQYDSRQASIALSIWNILSHGALASI